MTRTWLSHDPTIAGNNVPRIFLLPVWTELRIAHHFLIPIRCNFNAEIGIGFDHLNQLIICEVHISQEIEEVYCPNFGVFFGGPTVPLFDQQVKRLENIDRRI